ncbi:uncharacterized protein LOC143028404 isoform X2 [Oratosquilla oratoria]|uniref:uncharacterized protein LOC143028404 isoform X2 n=1 Tax=Oratosquilla oratoria TaxID=337810 RepID=UPI003F75E33E
MMDNPADGDGSGGRELTVYSARYATPPSRHPDFTLSLCGDPPPPLPPPYSGPGPQLPPARTTEHQPPPPPPPSTTTTTTTTFVSNFCGDAVPYRKMSEPYSVSSRGGTEMTREEERRRRASSFSHVQQKQKQQPTHHVYLRSSRPGLGPYHHHHLTYPPYPPIPSLPHLPHSHPQQQQYKYFSRSQPDFQVPRFPRHSVFLSPPLEDEPSPLPPKGDLSHSSPRLPLGRWEEDPCPRCSPPRGRPPTHAPSPREPPGGDMEGFVGLGRHDVTSCAFESAPGGPPLPPPGPPGPPSSFSSNMTSRQPGRVEDEQVYSYAGEGILSPAEVIRAQALLEESDGYGESVSSENIYEEIPDRNDIGGLVTRAPPAQKKSWRKSLIEEVMDEYEKVKSGHRKIIPNPNLDVDDLIRPDVDESSISMDSGVAASTYDVPRPRTPDHGPATSGKRHSPTSTTRSSGVASSVDEGKGSVRNAPEVPKHILHSGVGRLVKCESLDLKDVLIRRPSGGRGQSLRSKLEGMKEKIEKRGWKLPHFSRKDKKSSVDMTVNSEGDGKDTDADGSGTSRGSQSPSSTKNSSTGFDGPQSRPYSLIDSRSSRSSRSSTLSGQWEERIYEDINDIGTNRAGRGGSSGAGSESCRGGSAKDDEVPGSVVEDGFISRRLYVHRQLSSSDSWGSEEFESYSSNEEENGGVTHKEAQTSNLENIKQRLLKKREQWKKRRISSKNMKETLQRDAKENASEVNRVAEDSVPSTPDSKLYRWFSLRKSVNYNVEKRNRTMAGSEKASHIPVLDSTINLNSVSSTLTTTSSASSSSAPSNRLVMPLLPEEGKDLPDGKNSRFPLSNENMERRNGDDFFTSSHFQRRHQPPTLPTMPQGLSSEKIKRRHIISSIIHSENNYVATLHRLVNEYKKPLEDSKPPIINSTKLNILFHRVSEILQCHNLFRIALCECVRQWDKEEKIGDVFVASFSKSIVLDIYSDFINNFTKALEVAKQESKKKSAFADFLKMRQITSPDRLSFFGLMVKPVQRFPQFILFLQDLLKHTPQGHHDRMSLQLALTQLESLAEMLNERKRETEQYQAFRETLKHVNTKFIVRGIEENNRYLLREDNVTQLEFNPSGLISKSKMRRLFLTNDLLICVSVVPKSSDDFSHHNERLSLKWAYSVMDIEVQDTSSSPTLSRLLAAGQNKTGSLNSAKLPSDTSGASNVDNLCQDMNNLMHDYEVVSRISRLISTLKEEYEDITLEKAEKAAASIQRAIHHKDEQIAWVESCCLQFTVKTKERKEKETFTFQTENPRIKKDWIVELRLAQLALDSNNSPAWDVPEQEQRPSTKMPLFVKALPVFSSAHQTVVKCGCCYTTLTARPNRSSQQQTYLWLCSTDGMSSHITIYLMQQVGMRELVRLDMVEVCVAAMHYVPGLSSQVSLHGDTVWIGTQSHRLIVYSGMDPEKQIEVGSTSVPSAVTTIKYHCDQVYVGLCTGILQVYKRGADGSWALKEPLSIVLGTNVITTLLPINTQMYAACMNKVQVIDCFTADIMHNFEVHHPGAVQLMAHSGIGLWIAQHNTSTICLYHTETFEHLQDINIASNVSRILNGKKHKNTSMMEIHVTALMASKGLLWVGTNVGMILTIPLPRLEGIPIISGRVNISYHAHLGPITFLLALQPFLSHGTRMSNISETRRMTNRLTIHEESPARYQTDDGDRSSTSSGPTVSNPPASCLEKKHSDGSLLPLRKIPPKLQHQLSSPVILRRKTRDMTYSQVRRLSKTLPRGLGAGLLGSSQDCNVYGLYGDLLNVQDFDGEPLIFNNTMLYQYSSLRRSDPELALPSQVSTLDRRVKLKASRPRSLDLSNWSMASSLSVNTTSTGSEDSGPPLSAITSSTGTSPSLNRHCSTSTTTSHTSSGFNSNLSGVSHSLHETCNTHSTIGHGTLVNKKDSDQPRTLMTLVGGRGYINWHCNSSSSKLAASLPSSANTLNSSAFSSSHNSYNDKDAYVIIWEMKL